MINTFNLQLTHQNYHDAINCLYALVKQSSGSVASLSALVEQDNLLRLKMLQQLVFGHKTNSNAGNHRESHEQGKTMRFSQQDGELLIASILKKQPRWKKFANFKFSMKLNP